MSPMVHDLLILASEGAEGISGDHIASKLAVPLGIVIFCGAVFALLWSNYGAKKGGLVYGTAFFGFCFMLGIFWWFGAPGTPVATGLQNFPGQAPDAYQAKWYPFEPGSDRAEVFPATQGVGADASLDQVDELQPVKQYLGLGDVSDEEAASNPKFGSTRGDATTAGGLMTNLFLRTQDTEDPTLGGERRAQYIEDGEAGLAEQVDDPESYERAEPFFTAALADETVELGRSDGTLLAGATAQAFTNYVNADGETVQVMVDEQPMFAFKLESNLWFPSAVWTIISLILFVLCLVALDRVEQREKKALEEVQEPERLAVPIRQ